MNHSRPHTSRLAIQGACLVALVSAAGCQSLKSADDRAAQAARGGSAGLTSGPSSIPNSQFGGLVGSTCAGRATVSAGGSALGATGVGAAGHGGSPWATTAPHAGDAGLQTGASGASIASPYGGQRSAGGNSPIFGGNGALQQGGDTNQFGGANTGAAAGTNSGVALTEAGHWNHDASGANAGTTGGAGGSGELGGSNGESGSNGGFNISSDLASGGIAGAKFGLLDLHIDNIADATTAGPISIVPPISRWTGPINACFQPPSGKETGFSEEAQAAIRRAVTDSWGRVAAIHFEGFGPCLPPPAEQTNLKIALDTKLPTGVLGTVNLQGESALYAFTLLSFSTPSPSVRTIVHLFGHVLGFSHPQSTGNCDSVLGVGGAAADPQVSVMSQNPCYATSTLTPSDVVAAQNAYGRHQPGSLVGMNAQCLETSDAVNSQRTSITTDSCLGDAPNQQWQMHANGYFGSSFVSGQILDAYNANDGSIVTIHDPNSDLTVNQVWRFESVEIRGIGNLCLDGEGDGASLGHNPQIRACNGSLGQRWSVEWKSTNVVRIHAAASNTSCVHASQKPGEQLELAQCDDDGATDTFVITALGELQRDGFCWGSAGGDARDGRLMLLEDCLPDGNTKRHQQYFLHGPFSNGLGKCLSTSTGDFKSYDLLYSYNCAETADFMWDYYFYPDPNSM